MKELKLIAVEGVIGVGKTSLAKILADKFHAGTVLEKFEDNPFLENFYADPKKFAFHAQIYFLMSRYRQQREIAQIDLFQSRLISDYLFAKDRIFAEINLGEDEFALYDKIFGLIQKDIPSPDLVLYLQADPELLYRRIKHRDRKFERNIEFDYIKSLGEAYNAFFFHYNQSPVLIINIKGFDFIGNDHDLVYLCNEIRNLKEPRRIVSRS
ncbi:deoxyadenosine kinase [candidate division WOR-3 bacterium RBG_13_43_14]|uniref:Deoxyadenosine kinase n=1 Tax=candidate division WOR-3 bacterium RBG_13_43_14 TaxID=1802590 RepID=A0A1F4U282_UNCW3|nr:MAG: deoxyadenosine kinase [candidate division WOR-3 bacterium RBG_13_43_14]